MFSGFNQLNIKRRLNEHFNISKLNKRFYSMKIMSMKLVRN